MRQIENGLMEFSKKEVVGEVMVKVKLTENDIETIMVNGLEGGIGYWARLMNVGEDWEAKPKGIPLSQWATELLLQGKEVIFTDVEEDNGEELVLTLEKLIKGFQLNAEKRPWDADLENGDVVTADSIIQYAVFGELVYG